MRERDFGGVRATDPETSAEAAASARLSELEGRTLAVLRRSHRGETTHEIAEALGVERDSISPRMKNLVRLGLAVDTDQRRVPPGRARASTVWAAATRAQPKPPDAIKAKPPSQTLFGEAPGQSGQNYD